MMEFNWPGVLVATLLSFAFGALWYSPLLFMKRWCRESGVDPAKDMANPLQVYSTTFLLTLMSAFTLAFLLGPHPGIDSALMVALLTGVGLTAASMGINYQFAGRSRVYWFIDAGFHVCRFVIIALTLALWP